MNEPRLNIGWKRRRPALPPNTVSDGISAGISDGFRGTPDPRWLARPGIARSAYLNGYQCGFRSRKNPHRGEDRHAWMGDAFLAMHEPRYPHDVPPIMG